MLHYETCLISILSSVPINANPAKIIISLNLVFNPPELAPSSYGQTFEALTSDSELLFSNKKLLLISQLRKCSTSLNLEVEPDYTK